MTNTLLPRACAVLSALVLLLAASPDARGQGLDEDTGGVPDYVHVRTSHDRESYAPGDVARITVELKIDPRVHINSDKPTADYQFPTSLTWDETGGATLSDVTWPKSLLKAFEFTDGEKIAVYEGTQKATLTATIPKDAAPGTLDLVGTFRAQGCTHSVCYAPQSDDLKIALKIVAAGSAPAAAASVAPTAVAAPPPATTPTAASTATTTTPTTTTSPVEPAAEPVPSPVVDPQPAVLEPATTTSEPVAAAPVLAAALNGEAGEDALDCPVSVKDGTANKPLLGVFVLSFLGGLLLTFTPCVLPLVPITIGFFSRQRASGGRPILPALCYVLGLALVYSVLGTFAALTGGLFGQALQSPVVLIIIAAILLALALSMFGLWDLQLPAAMSNKLGGGKSGLLGAGVMGGAMGLIAAPCVGPFVVSLLTYVADLGSRMPRAEAALIGGSLFFVLALGLGMPFFLVALGVGSIRPGEWMVTVKKVFGFIIFGVVLWFLRPLIGAAAFQWGIVAVLAGAAVFFILSSRSTVHGPRMRAAMGVVGALAGLAMLVGAVSLLRAPSAVAASGKEPVRAFVPYSDAALDGARASGKPVVIDFMAEWCIACKELEHETFPSREVQEKFEGFTLLQADLTDDEDPKVRALYKKFKIRGLPTIVFLDSRGEEIPALRLTGFEPPPDFASRLTCAKSIDIAQAR